MKQENINKARIAGTVTAELKAYECCGEQFYSFILSSKRDSDVCDNVRVNISQYLLKTVNVGDKIQLVGQIRTYDKMTDGKRKLIITFFAQAVEEYTRDINEVELTGSFCKVPTLRITPLGRTIADALIAVNRPRGKADYIPLIVWGRTASHISELGVGAVVMVQGRLQSREYQKKQPDGSFTTMTAYEVSVNRISEVAEE